MAAGHRHFEELAVGHVLGGLEHDDAARFRTHLTGCRECRARVAELRDIASDLKAAERDELSRAQVKTEVARRDTDDDPLEPSWVVPTRTVSVVVVTAVLVAVALAFWNFHLRDQNARLLEVTLAREAILDGLATGRPVPTELSGAVTGHVVADATDVTVDLAGLPDVTGDDRLVVWLLGEDATDHYWRRYGPGELTDGRLAFRDPHRDALRLVVTVEDDLGDEPAGRELVAAELDQR